MNRRVHWTGNQNGEGAGTERTVMIVPGRPCLTKAKEIGPSFRSERIKFPRFF